MDTYRTGKLTDKAVLSFFAAVESQFGQSSFSASIQNVSVEPGSQEIIDLIGKKSSYTLNNVCFITKGGKFRIDYKRGITRNNHREASIYFDEIIVTPGQPYNNQVSPSAVDVFKLSEIITKHTVNVTANADDEAKDAVNLLQSQISSLSVQYQSMIDDLSERRDQLEKKYEEKLKLLQDENDAEKERIAQHEKETNEKLNQRAQELDDRDHRHVRRYLREDINSQISQKLSGTLISKQASWMRLVVFFLSLVGAIFLGYLSYSSFSDFSSTLRNPINIGKEQSLNINSASSNNLSHNAILWALLLKSFFASLGSIAFLAYAVGWLKKLYQDDVSAQSQLERYAYDINRASWAIETIMDVKKDGTLPPETWIRSVCNDLFNGKMAPNDKYELSPLEALLMSSAKIEIGSNGTKFEIGSKGAKKLAKEMVENK